MYPWWLRLQKHCILTGCARKPHLLRGYDLKSLQWLCFLIPMIVLQNPLPSRNEGAVLLVSRMQSVQCPQHLRQRCLPEAELRGNPSFSSQDRYSVTAIFFSLALSDTRCFWVLSECSGARLMTRCLYLCLPSDVVLFFASTEALFFPFVAVQVCRGFSDASLFAKKMAFLCTRCPS